MYKNGKFAILYPTLLALAVAGGILMGSTLFRPSVEGVKNTTPASGSRKLNYTFGLINSMYVDHVNWDTLAEALLPKIIGELDPHSVYVPASEMVDANYEIDGQFDGIGIVFNMATDTIIVNNVISGGPSDKAGIRNGDRIMTIDDSLVAGRKINQNDIVKRLRGKRGTKVNLGIQRDGIAALVPVTVERGVIPVKSLDAAFMITPQTGFVKISAFSRNTHDEFMSALSSLSEDGMKNLILDLRGNGGGILEQAEMMANEFLDKGKDIVITDGLHQKRIEQKSDGKGRYQTLPLVVLIDEWSASASEIVAGAIQDNDRGTIIGRRSFGKGLVQQQFPLGDGSALRLTIARYYTPTGRSIQKPYTHDTDAYLHDLQRRYEHSEFFSADSIRFDDSLKYTTPGGRTVYGGGGIMPDIFIPLDTTGMTRFYLEVSGRNILYRYTIEYTDRHLAELDKVKTTADLDAFFGRHKDLYEGFVSYATGKGIKISAAETESSRKLITAQLRAYIGRNTPLSETGFYANIYPVDNVTLRALEELKR